MKFSALPWLTVVGGVGLALGCSSDRYSSASHGGFSGSTSGEGAMGSSAEPNTSVGQAPSAGGQSNGTATHVTGVSSSNGESGSTSGPTLNEPLGMNDVTILVPLPENIDQPVLLRGSESADDGTPFVPKLLLDRLGSDELFLDAYEQLQLVAVRFDLCDHNAPGPCPLSGEASLRLVFQPLRVKGAADVGVHAFYAIGETEVPAALRALRELAALRSGPAEPLAPSVSLATGNVEYTEKLRAFVRAYGGEGRLIRLAVNAQSANSAAVTWFFREFERRGTEFEERSITGTTETTQRVNFAGDAFFEVEPVSDAPPGLARVLDRTEFRASSEAEQRAALETLVAIDNPLTNGPDTVACVACHTSTVALATRAKDMNLDPDSLVGRYTTSFDVSVGAGMSATNDRTLRALGWIGTTPMISQRVANDTALVLDDIARRFE